MRPEPVKREGLNALSPIGRETAQDRVYKQLREGLIRGAFEAGEPFLVGDVAARMSVSSMPVREALARLVSERALEALPNRRVRVPLLTQARASDIARARALIEGDLVATALPNLTHQDIYLLEKSTADYELSADEGAIALNNYAFHFQLYRRANSPVLMSFAESLWMQAGPFVRAAARLYKPLVDPAATLHHQGILDAVRDQDNTKLIQELRADIALAFDILERAGPEVWDCVVEHD